MKILTWNARMEKGLTLTELARISGLGKSTLNNIENGKSDPNMYQMELIAMALKMHISDLYESDFK